MFILIIIGDKRSYIKNKVFAQFNYTTNIYQYTELIIPNYYWGKKIKFSSKRIN